jgi:hypothetical protein
MGLDAKVRLGLAAILALAAALAVYAYAGLSRIGSLQARLNTGPLPSSHRIGEIEAMIRRDRALTLKHISAGTREEKIADEAEAIAVETGIGKALNEHERNIGSDEERSLFESVKTSWADFSRIRDASVLPLSRGLKRSEAEDADKRLLAPAFTELSRSVEASVAWSRSDAGKAGRDLKAAADSVKTGILAGSGILILLAGTIGVSLGRAAASVRKDSGIRTAASAEQGMPPETAASPHHR